MDPQLHLHLPITEHTIVTSLILLTKTSPRAWAFRLCRVGAPGLQYIFLAVVITVVDAVVVAFAVAIAVQRHPLLDCPSTNYLCHQLLATVNLGTTCWKVFRSVTTRCAAMEMATAAYCHLLSNPPGPVSPRLHRPYHSNPNRLCLVEHLREGQSVAAQAENRRSSRAASDGCLIIHEAGVEKACPQMPPTPPRPAVFPTRNTPLMWGYAHCGCIRRLIRNR